MTNHEDTILGVVVSNGETTRTYTSHKVEYDSTESLTELLTVAEEVEQEGGTLTEVDMPLEESETTLEEYIGHGSLKDKDGASGEYTDESGAPNSYTRRLLVEDGKTLDAVTAELDALGVPYSAEDVSPTPKERHVIEREGARNAQEIEKALGQKAELLDRELVTDETKVPIAEAIDSMKGTDPELAGALDNVFEVMTGETSQELLDRLDTEQQQ